jgi:hypothetical protein
LLQDVPDLRAVIENRPMLRLIEIKKIRWRKHKEDERRVNRTQQ